ncbi:unnamed protein product [Parnassius apollo]|uniref:(apollo) hypothetical protein n=1 Tax=Parnassius apollo TaxID=110799 RepID=A0A8S3XAA8_PARAO|nr:unnamed protein product [Parnassius apollo]
MTEFDVLWCESDDGDLSEEEEEIFSHNNVGQQLECKYTTQQVNPPLPVSPSFTSLCHIRGHTHGTI